MVFYRATRGISSMRLLRKGNVMQVRSYISRSESVTADGGIWIVALLGGQKAVRAFVLEVRYEA